MQGERAVGEHRPLFIFSAVVVDGTEEEIRGTAAGAVLAHPSN